VPSIEKLGYECRSGKGSHILFRRGTLFLNLQSQRGKAKAYQVRQVLEQLTNH
jgi:hypothetical protein